MQRLENHECSVIGYFPHLSDFFVMFLLPFGEHLREGHIVSLGYRLARETLERLQSGGLGLVISDYDLVLGRDPRTSPAPLQLVHGAEAVGALERLACLLDLLLPALRAIFRTLRQRGSAFDARGHLFHFLLCIFIPRILRDSFCQFRFA